MRVRALGEIEAGPCSGEKGLIGPVDGEGYAGG